MAVLAAEAAVGLSGLRFAYGSRVGEDPTPILQDFDLTVSDQERLVVLGSSGSGKSTLGRLLAGMLVPQAGSRTTASPKASDVVYVDQHPMNSVFPWQTVRKNVAYPLRKLGWSAEKRKDRVARLLSLFELEPLAGAWPAQLSGGQLQRVALARCLGWMPKVLILDEALAALDARSRSMTVDAIKTLSTESEATLIAITHDIADAYRMGRRCIVLGGRPAGIVLDLEIESNGSSRSRAEFEKAILGAIHGGHL